MGFLYKPGDIDDLKVKVQASMKSQDVEMFSHPERNGFPTQEFLIVLILTDSLPGGIKKLLSVNFGLKGGKI